MYRGVNSLESLSDIPGIAPQTSDMGDMPLADSLTMCYSDGLDGIQRRCNGSLWMVKGPGIFNFGGLAPQQVWGSFEYVSTYPMPCGVTWLFHSRGATHVASALKKLFSPRNRKTITFDRDLRKPDIPTWPMT